MQSFYPSSFAREMGCTEAQWLGWLDQAVGERPQVRHADAREVSIGHGTLRLSWQPLAPRVIGLVSLPVLAVRFEFEGLDAAQRYAFMQRFDLYMQRGGG